MFFRKTLDHLIKVATLIKWSRKFWVFQILQERALHGMEITHGCERKSPQQKHVSVVGRKATPPTECLKTLTRV